MRQPSARHGFRQSSVALIIIAVGAAIGVIAWRNSLHAERVEAGPQPVAVAAPRGQSAPLHPAAAAPAPLRNEIPMTARAATPDPDPIPGTEIMLRARAARERGDLLTARRDYLAAMATGLPDPAAAEVRQELSSIADRTLFSPNSGAGDPLIIRHRITPGETLARIAARYRIPADLIAHLNNLSNKQRILSGQSLRVVQGPFRVVVVKSAFRLDVFLGDVFVRSFAVGLGTNGSTPTGTWRVIGKLTNPSWNDPRSGRRYAADDPTNPIGEHWIGLEGLSGDAVGKIGFGIHGTTDPASIGHNASLGCVRMNAQDVAQLYDWLFESHSTVEVR